MTPKQRLSASVDSSLLAAAEDAVAQGRAPTLSAWVSDALQLKLAHDRKLGALSDFIAKYEAEHGEITADEMRTAARHARARGVVVRGPEQRQRKTRRAGSSR